MWGVERDLGLFADFGCKAVPSAGCGLDEIARHFILVSADIEPGNRPKPALLERALLHVGCATPGLGGPRGPPHASLDDVAGALCEVSIVQDYVHVRATRLVGLDRHDVGGRRETRR